MRLGSSRPVVSVEGVTSFNRLLSACLGPDRTESDDVRCDPLEGRKVRLETILAKTDASIQFSELMECDGDTVSRHASKLGLEGVMSKRKTRVYRLWPFAGSAQDEVRLRGR